MVVVAVLRHRKTGRQGRYEHDWPDSSGLRGVLWLWTEGNYACDCNRSIFLLGRDLDNTLSCNSDDPTIELVELSVDGRRFAACDMT